MNIRFGVYFGAVTGRMGRGKIGQAILCAVVSLVGAHAMADSLRGFVTIQGSQVSLLPVSDQGPLVPKPLPIQTTLAIRTSLLELKSGDFVVVSGHLDDSDRNGLPDLITIQGIESVGLKDVIGTWRSAKWEVVRFEDFSRMSLYRRRFRYTQPGPTPGSELVAPSRDQFQGELRKMDLAKLKDLNYTLAPEQGSSYSIFLVEKKASGPAAVYVGRLGVQKRAQRMTLKLEIFDPKTGESAEVLSLSPVRE